MTAGRDRAFDVGKRNCRDCDEPLTGSGPQAPVAMHQCRKSNIPHKKECSCRRRQVELRDKYCIILSRRSAMLEYFLTRLSPSSVVAYGTVVLIARLLYNKYGTGLNHIPGPFLASFTDFYRLAVARGYRSERWHIELHKQYGDFVRIGPRTVLCSSNKAAKKIYALNAGFVKVSKRDLP